MRRTQWRRWRRPRALLTLRTVNPRRPSQKLLWVNWLGSATRNPAPELWRGQAIFLLKFRELEEGLTYFSFKAVPDREAPLIEPPFHSLSFPKRKHQPVP